MLKFLWPLLLAAGIAASSALLSAAPTPTTAYIAYQQTPIPVKPDSCGALFSELQNLVKKDEFEKTAARAARLAAAPISSRDIRILVESSQVEITPHPDEGVYLVALSPVCCPMDNQPAIITVWVESTGTREVVLQNAYGAKTNGTSGHLNVLKLGVSNWNTLNRGLIWKNTKEKSDVGFGQPGLPFKDPSPELLAKMKAHKLGLWLKVRLSKLDLTDVAESFHTATIDNPNEFSETAITVPAEILSLGVVSDDGSTSYGIWSRDAQIKFEEILKQQAAAKH